MKQGASLIFATSLFVATFVQAQSRPAALQQILPLLQQEVIAANAHDTDAFLATYIHDPSLIFIVDGEVIHGFTNLREQQLKWWRNGKSDVVYSEQADPEIVSLDARVALVTQQLATHRTLPDGTSHDDKFVVTSIWELRPAGWRVAYCHESHTR